SSADQPMVARIEVRNSHLAVWLMHPGQEGTGETTAPPAPIDENSALLIPWTKPPAKRFKEILLPASSARSRARPMKAERRRALLESMAGDVPGSTRSSLALPASKALPRARSAAFVTST